jgi:hypothetical protein
MVNSRHDGGVGTISSRCSTGRKRTFTRSLPPNTTGNTGFKRHSGGEGTISSCCSTGRINGTHFLTTRIGGTTLPILQNNGRLRHDGGGGTISSRCSTGWTSAPQLDNMGFWRHGGGGGTISSRCSTGWINGPTPFNRFLLPNTTNNMGS